LRDELDPESVGGAYLLGLRAPVVICHGSSSRVAIANAIELAVRGEREHVVGRTRAALETAGALRGGEHESSTADGDAEPNRSSVPADSVEAR
jgi:hypothetical protein